MRLIINIILFIVAVILTVLLFLPSIVYSIFDVIKYGSVYRRLNYYFLNSAVSIDIMANSVFSNMLNGILIKKGGHYFGSKNSTISEAIGINFCIGKLSFVGLGLCGILNMIHKNHCYNSITDQEFLKKYPEPKKIPSYITIIITLISIGILYSLFILCSIFI